MRAKKYDYELIVQMKTRGSGWEDIETVQTDSIYYYNLNWSLAPDPREHRRAANYAQYLKNESALAYGHGFSFRTIRRRTKKGAQA